MTHTWTQNINCNAEYFLQTSSLVHDRSGIATGSNNPEGDGGI